MSSFPAATGGSPQSTAEHTIEPIFQGAMRNRADRSRRAKSSPYGTSQRARQDSNLRPMAPEAIALSN